MTAYGCKLKQNANEGYNSCASSAGLVLSFIACFISLVIAPLPLSEPAAKYSQNEDTALFASLFVNRYNVLL